MTRTLNWIGLSIAMFALLILFLVTVNETHKL
jgi:hypothetical protein